MPTIPFKTHAPRTAEGLFLAPDAWLIGDVEVGKNVSIFFGAVARGDILPIRIGDGTNIQEHALLHTSDSLSPCEVAQNVTVGHRAILHGCRVESRCIIGMGAIILDGAVVGSQSIVGAQSLVPMNMVIPPRSMVMGVPAKVTRQLSDAELAQLDDSARRYQELGREYREALRE